MKVLVASHDASRTGAPLLLLTFLRWLRRETDAELQLVLWRGGPLVNDLAEVAEVTVLHPAPGQRSIAETGELALAKAGLGQVSARLTGARVRTRLRVAPHDLLYLNGAGSALVLPHLRSDAPALAQIHELERGLTFSLPAGREDPFLTRPRRLVAVADRVAQHLVSVWHVDRERIAVVPGCLPDHPGHAAAATGPTTSSGSLVASVGAGSWRKGIDLFLEVAAAVRRELGPDVRFAWVGPLDDPPAVHSQVVELGLGGAVDLPGEVDDPAPWFSAMSAFCSTAREDPFPLVGLEAGAAGIPVIAFDSGGIAELLADGRGTVVPAGDVAAMVAAVVAQCRTPAPGRKAAARLQSHVAAHHTVAQMGPALWREMEVALSA